MKKRIYALLACIVMATVIFSGCGSNQSNEQNNNTESNTTQNTNYTSEDGRPPVEDELKDFYSEAEGLYRHLSLGGLPVDDTQKMERDSLTYYKSDSPLYHSLAELRTYLETYFTPAFVDQEILREDSISFIEDSNGELYILDGGRGANIYYTGHVFELVERTDDRIAMTATVYYLDSNDAIADEIFYTTPENPENYVTQVYDFVLVKTGDDWRFDRFQCFY